jgi:hypothetical protein
MCGEEKRGRLFFPASGSKDGEEISSGYEVRTWVLNEGVW